MQNFRTGTHALLCISELVYHTLEGVVIDLGDADGLEMDFQALYIDYIELRSELSACLE